MKREQLLKLILGISLVAVLAIALPLAGGCAPEPAAPTEVAEEPPIYHWRMQTVYGAIWADILVAPWAEGIEEASGGRVEIDVYTSDELMPCEEMFRAVQTGTLDIIQSTGLDIGGEPDIVDFEGFVPLGWDSGIDFLVLWEYEGLGELYTAAWEELGGIHVIGAQPSDPTHIITTRPIEKYEDFQGLKIVANRNTAVIFEGAGVTSVNLPKEEFYLSGLTGIIDGLMWCGATESYSSGWHEVFPYFVSQPVGGAWNMYLMANGELWDSLTSDIQAIVTQSNASLALAQVLYYAHGEEESRQYMKVTTLPDEDWAKVVEQAFNAWDVWGQKSPRCAEIFRILEEHKAGK